MGKASGWLGLRWLFPRGQCQSPWVAVLGAAHAVKAASYSCGGRAPVTETMLLLTPRAEQVTVELCGLS